MSELAQAFRTRCIANILLYSLLSIGFSTALVPLSLGQTWNGSENVDVFLVSLS